MYAEALQNPQRCFADSDLMKGVAISDSLGLPFGAAGSFGIVFPVKTPKRVAVKCFTHEIADLQLRYDEIKKHIGSRRFSGLVDFAFRQRGILVAGSWYPILRMEWAAGETLDSFVAKSRHYPDQLRHAAVLLGRTVSQLNADGIAHGDLQHGNIVINGGILRLVDYDGMYVPALAGNPPSEGGHPNYRHPARGSGDYGPDMDRFSSLTIKLSLLAVANDPSLWDRYYDGTNLLFTMDDFSPPGRTAIWTDLRSIKDPEVRALTDLLAEWCLSPASKLTTADWSITDGGMGHGAGMFAFGGARGGAGVSFSLGAIPMNVQHVVFLGSDSKVHETYWWDGRWYANCLCDAAGGAARGTGRAATYTLGDEQHAIYRGYESHVHELWGSDGNWHHNDLTEATDWAPPAASDPVGYVMGASQHVVYRGYDSHIHELWWDRDWDSQWRHSDLTEASAGSPPAAGDPAGYVMGASQQHIVYRGYDSHIHELWWDRDDPPWHHNDLTDSSGGAPPAASDPAGYVMGASQHVVYRGHDSHIHELWWWDGHWAFGDLTQQTGGWAQAVGAPTGNSWPGDVLAG
jgi:hypothetical protein